MTRDRWLKKLRKEAEEHLGTLRIYGREVNMCDVEELNAALVWLAWTTTIKLTSMQELLNDQ